MHSAFEKHRLQRFDAQLMQAEVPRFAIHVRAQEMDLAM
jgi:hypothetical protein